MLWRRRISSWTPSPRPRTWRSARYAIGRSSCAATPPLLRVTYFRCPRCRKLFRIRWWWLGTVFPWVPFGDQCVHCGIEAGTPKGS